jgi:glycosyltransferase involved in cell wall biosynthesis
LVDVSRTLILVPDPIDAPVSGGELRNRMVAESVSSSGPVLVVSLYGNSCRAGAIRMESLGQQSARQLWGSRQAGMFTLTPDEQARLASLVAEFSPDRILVEHVALANLLQDVRPAGVTLIFDMHNIESDLARHMAGAEPIWRFVRRRRMLAAADALAVAEDRIQDHADAVWVCSASDREVWTSRHGGDAHIVPNTVPPSAERTSVRPRRGVIRPRLIFVGHLGYQPNVRAIRELCREVMPLLAKACPDVTLTVAGRAPGRRVKRLEGPLVRVMADVPDLAELLSAAEITVIPLREGGGTRIKVLEAVASGVLVVATGLAVEGLELEDGRHFIRAETAQQMADAVLGLIRDPDRAERMRDEARDFIMKHYSQAAVSETIRLRLASASHPVTAPVRD